MALLRHRHHWLGFLLRSQTTLGCTASRPGTHSNPVTSTFSCQRSYSIVKPGRVSPHRNVPIHIKKPPYAGWLKRMPKKKKDVEIKTDDQILAMRESCAVARDILQLAGEKARVGVSTDEIDEFVHSLCIEKGVYPSPLHYRGFPKSICTSVNNVACHGIPDDRPLEDGDIVNIDITVFHKGFHGDTSSMFLVGNVDSKGHTLVEAARRCRDEAIAMCGPGIPLHYIGCTISQICEEIHMDVIPQFCGHGIGTYFHGPPDIFHFANEMNGVMKSGTIFTIEPIITEGLPPIRILEDDWTAISEDNSRSAQFEHTILITENGAEILT